jgi:hypothetical protein
VVWNCGIDLPPSFPVFAPLLLNPPPPPFRPSPTVPCAGGAEEASVRPRRRLVVPRLCHLRDDVWLGELLPFLPVLSFVLLLLLLWLLLLLLLSPVGASAVSPTR